MRRLRHKHICSSRTHSYSDVHVGTASDLQMEASVHQPALISTSIDQQCYQTAISSFQPLDLSSIANVSSNVTPDLHDLHPGASAKLTALTNYPSMPRPQMTSA